MTKYFRIALLGASLVVALIGRAQQSSWYKSFTGSIDKYPISIHLHKIGEGYSGYYYYKKTQQLIQLAGDDTVAGPGKIRVVAYELGYQETYEAFIFSINGNQLTGEWQKKAGVKGLPLTATENTLPPGFDLVYVEGGTKLRKSLKESPEATYSASTIWPKGSSPSSIFLKKWINGAFGAKNSVEDVGKTLLANKKRFIDGYLADNKDLKDSEIAEFPTGFNLQDDQSILVAYQSANLLTLAQWNYSYSGGAHGNYGTSYTAIDLQANRVLKLTEVILPSGKKKLNSLLEKYFRKQMQLKPTDSLSDGGLFDNKIEANENFYVTGKGMGFNYVPYEIASYAQGQISIFIPYTELIGILQPAFRKLVSL